MLAPINVFYFDCLNFGDAINPFLFGKITGCPIIRCESPLNRPHVVGIGSIANWANRQSTVIGSGLANKDDKINPNCHLRLLRGPITADIARACGNKSNFFLGDPVLALPSVGNFKRVKTCEIGIVPHYVDYEATLSLFENSTLPVKIIDIKKPIKEFISDVVSCKRVISSSLHGLILADAFGIPNIKTTISTSILGDGTKFLDYFLSVKRDYRDYDVREILSQSCDSIYGMFEDVRIPDLTQGILRSFTSLSKEKKAFSNATWR
jgi:hypothetical protein